MIQLPRYLPKTQQLFKELSLAQEQAGQGLGYPPRRVLALPGLSSQNDGEAPPNHQRGLCEDDTQEVDQGSLLR